mmetsp:Transcript_48029/g.53776  ORF Transcript_48029/g.53776 Transcript_48029/m.53776 type:complete len:91 (-) Transcript_48029:89-361(-)
MMNADVNPDTPQEWKKRKGFIPTIVGTSLLGLAFFSAGQLFANNNKDKGGEMNVIRGVKVDGEKWNTDQCKHCVGCPTEHCRNNCENCWL